MVERDSATRAGAGSSGLMPAQVCRSQVQWSALMGGRRLQEYQERERSLDLDAAMASLFDRGGTLAEVAEVRRRCIDGAVANNLAPMKGAALAAFSATTYALKAEAAAESPWLREVVGPVVVFTTQLNSCGHRVSRSRALDDVRSLCPPLSAAVCQPPYHAVCNALGNACSTSARIDVWVRHVQLVRR